MRVRSLKVIAGAVLTVIVLVQETRCTDSANATLVDVETPPTFIVRADTVGGLRLSAATEYRSAFGYFRRFYSPIYRTFPEDLCRMNIVELKLVMQFWGLPGSRGCVFSFAVAAAANTLV